MTVTEAIERYHLLAREGRPDEGLKVLLEASHEHGDPALEHEIAYGYEERGWARCEDRSPRDFPSHTPDLPWNDAPRSNALALDDFEESLSWAERPEPMAGKAFLLLDSDSAGAERLLLRAAELDPELPLINAVYARLWIRRGDWSRAIEAAKKAVEAPDFPAAHLALAEALAGAGRRSEALEALERGTRAMPYNLGLLIAWARALDDAGERERAAAVWSRAIEINRLNAEAWRGLAGNAAVRGDDGAARRALGEAERLDPGGTRAWLARHPGLFPA
jgi:tetratricopeptide (TPR) repeat protein